MVVLLAPFAKFFEKLSRLTVKDKKGINTSLQNPCTVLPSESFPDWRAANSRPSSLHLHLGTPVSARLTLVGPASPLASATNANKRTDFATGVLNLLCF